MYKLEYSDKCTYDVRIYVLGAATITAKRHE